MLRIFIIYLLLVNLIAFLLMAIDKSKAQKNKWRIPEKTLFISAAVGGSIGAILGMYTFRHKTKHLTFIFGMPLILIVQLLITYFIIIKFT